MALPKFLSNIGHAVSSFVGGVGNAFAGTPTDQQKKKKLLPPPTPGLPIGLHALGQATNTATPIKHPTISLSPSTLVKPPVIKAPVVSQPNASQLTPQQKGANFIKLLNAAHQQSPYNTQSVPGTAPVALKIGKIVHETITPPAHLLQIPLETGRQMIAKATHNTPAYAASDKRERQLLQPEHIIGDSANSLLDALTLGTGSLLKEGGQQVVSTIAPRIASKIGIDIAGRHAAGDLGKLGIKEIAKHVTKDIANQTAYGVAGEASNGEDLSPENLKRSVVSALTFGGLGGVLVHSPDIIKSVRELSPVVRTTVLRTASHDSPIQTVSTDALTSYEKASDPKTVAYYKQQIKEGKPVDPLIVMPDSAGNLGVEDGKHRLEAYRQLGITNVPIQLTTPDRLTAALKAGNLKSPQALGIVEDQPKSVQLQAATATDVPVPPAAADPGVSLSEPVPTPTANAPLQLQAANDVPLNDNPAAPSLNAAAAKLGPNDLMVAGDNKIKFNDGSGVPATPTGDGIGVSLSQPPAGKATRFASTTVPESDVVSKELGETVKAGAPTYTVATEKAGLGESLNRMQQQGIDGLATDVQHRLQSPLGNISRQDVFDAETVAAALDVRHDPASLQLATDIYDKLSEHLTASGQTIQAAAIIARRSPEGLRQFAQTQFRKAGVDLTPELQNDLAGMIETVRGTTTGTEERSRAVAGLMQFIGKHIPSQAVDKLVGIYKAGLLTGLRTQTGNALSNGAFLALKKASDPVAVAFDKAIGLVTGKRSKTLTLGGLGSGAKEGVQKGYLYLKTGIDERNLNNDKYEVGKTLNFKNPIINGYVNGVFRLMGAADQPVWYSSYRNNLVDLAKTEALNQGLRGGKARTYASDLVTKPSEAMQATASEAATKAVLGNDTIGSKAAAAVLNASNNPIYRAFAHTTMPFTKVPSAFISRVFDYTPVGAVKEVISQIYRGKFDQRKLAEALAEATTGTAGAITLGSALSKAGLLTGAYPTDPKEQQAWKAEGKQENSIKVGDKWRSLNYAGPFGALFGIGANFEKSLSGGATVGDALVTATSGAVQSALNQSFLSGVSGLLDAINQPEQSAKQFINNEASSVIPTLVGDVSKAGDNMQRTATSALDAVKAKIPGARETLPVKQDAFGNPLARPEGALGTVVDPLRSTEALDTPLTKELDRLQTQKQGVFPTPAKTLEVGKQTVKLTPEQQNTFNSSVGQQVQSAWNDIIKSPDYAKLPDDGKKQLLQSALDDVTAVEKQKMLSTLGHADLAGAVKLTSQQKLVAGGGLNPQDYVQKAVDKAQGVSSNNVIVKVNAMDTQTRDAYLADPKNNYNYELAVYNDDINGGKLSQVQRYTKALQIGKLKVLSNYSADANELYGLSKTQLTAYLADNKITQKVADELQTMDQQLYNQGFIESPKYENGLTGSSKKAPAPPTPKFGNLGLVSVPHVGLSSGDSAVSDFKNKVARIGSLKRKVAPVRNSPVKIAV